MQEIYKPIGNFIRVVNQRNKDLTVKQLIGLSIDKCYIPSVANVIGTDLSTYKIIKRKQFACSLMQVSRDEKIPIACMTEYDEAIMSPAYVIFEIIDESLLLPEYLDMWVMRAEFDREASFLAVGGVRGSLAWDDFCRMKLPVPTIEEQNRVVKAYKTITERIELKKRINDNLEEQLTALFKEKIIDNEELLEVEPLDSKIAFINGLAMQNFRPEETEACMPVIKIRELSQGFCDSNSEFCTDKIDETHIINNGDLVFSWSGSLQVAFWTSHRAGLNQHLFKVESSIYPRWYVYLWVKHHLLDFQRIAENKGTTFGHIKREDLHSAMIKIVGNTEMASLCNVFEPILSIILNNASEMHRLTEVRKVLLAQLSR